MIISLRWDGGRSGIVAVGDGLEREKKTTIVVAVLLAGGEGSKERSLSATTMTVRGCAAGTKGKVVSRVFKGGEVASEVGRPL